MWQFTGIARFKRRNAVGIHAAFSFRRFLDLAKTGLAEHLIEVTEVEGSPVLSVAKNKI
jgi:hypothetical protein